MGLADTPQFKTLITPATLYTREVAIAVKVSTAEGNITRLPIKGDLYSAAAFHATPRVSEFGAFVCSGVEQGGDDHFWFYYCDEKTPEEAMQPYAPDETRYGNQYWPPILLDVSIEEIKLGRAVNTGDAVRFGKAYEAVPIWIPSADTGTLFVKRKMLSHEEPVIEQHPNLQTRAVSFPVVGGRPFSFPENLGPEIVTRFMQDYQQSYATSGGAVTSQVGLVGPFTFKATDPETWGNVIVYDTPTRLAYGGYAREQLEAIPPNLPPVIRGFN